MSNQLQNDPVLASVEQAERELALYAAIIGHRPTMAIVPPAPGAAPTSAHQLEHPKHIHTPDLSHDHDHDHAHVEPRYRLKLWVREMSQQAKRRIGEAKSRLAS